MQLFIRGLECIETLEVGQDTNIAAVKAKIAQRHRWNIEEIALNCEGNALENETLISYLPSRELDITIPMLGGKVHGSLARAGKVRGQTPKVEKQDKKKKKTGRAKKRMQYNRRFAGIVARNGYNVNSVFI